MTSKKLQRIKKKDPFGGGGHQMIIFGGSELNSEVDYLVMLWQALKLSSGFGSTLIQSLSGRILFALNLRHHCNFVTKVMVAIRISKAEPKWSPCKAVHGDGIEHEDEPSDGRLEKTAKRAFVGAGARVLFYPTLLYNVVRNKLQPEFRWWDQIVQFLILGAVPFRKDVHRLKDLGVEAVVTLNEPYETLVPSSMYQDEGIKHLEIPTRDYLFAPSFDDIHQAVDFIHEHANMGKTTYVHCKAGRGRSTTIVLCYLVAHKGMIPVEAYAYVRSKRPRVLLAHSQWKAVHEYYQKINGNSSQTLEFPMPLDDNYEDSAVFVTNSDLDGYKSSEEICIVEKEL
ncbi:hypothetical protein KI387_000573 [Taxus chinensis]|uniref:phosphatidylglycerophosphatase n=1 Tax=Taxus chinensis TaxID=29808 RepID=A0AA38GUQ0_TAXCH|nr:hypothetical protein KI387_000573 [Taxus chinensis]